MIDFEEDLHGEAQEQAQQKGDNAMIPTTKHYIFKLFTLLIFFHTSIQALEIKYAPIIMDDIITFVLVFLLF